MTEAQVYELLREHRTDDTVNTDLLEPDFALRLALLIYACPDIKIVSGFRSFIAQKRLYEAWKAGTYKVPVVAVPGTSLHELGLAADLSTTRAWQEVHNRADVFGLYFPLTSELWHVEKQAGIGALKKEDDDDMQADEIKTVQITVEGKQYNYSDVIGWTLEQLNKLVRDVAEIKQELASK